MFENDAMRMSMKVNGIWDTVPAWRSTRHTSKEVRTSKQVQTSLGVSLDLIDVGPYAVSKHTFFIEMTTLLVKLP